MPEASDHCCPPLLPHACGTLSPVPREEASLGCVQPPSLRTMDQLGQTRPHGCTPPPPRTDSSDTLKRSSLVIPALEIPSGSQRQEPRPQEQPSCPQRSQLSPVMRNSRSFPERSVNQAELALTGEGWSPHSRALQIHLVALGSGGATEAQEPLRKCEDT